MKRLITGIIAAVVVTCTPLTAFADIGIWGGNMPTDSATPYMFEDRVISVYSNETDNDPDLSEVYPGSFLYIPIMVDTGTEEENWQQATEKQIKDDKVTVSHKVTYGSRYIDSVTIVDGKKEKISGVSSGAFAKIRVNDSYTNTRPTNVVVKLVLSVNRVSYQESELEIGFDLVNRSVYIDRDSVYGARVPTLFEAYYYDGEATFDLGDGVTYTAKVRDGQKYLINYVTDPEYDIEDMYPGDYLEFHRFLGDRDAFNSVGELEIPIKTSDFEDENGKPRVYAYQIDGSSLTALDSSVVSYKNGILTIRARTLGEYVLSGRGLLRDVAESADNDVLQSGYAAQNAESAAPTQPVAPSVQAPVSSTAMTPTPMATNNINANNVSGENPGTGTGKMLGISIAAAMIAGCVAAAMWRTRPFKKKEQ